VLKRGSRIFSPAPPAHLRQGVTRGLGWARQDSQKSSFL
jgi:hypothetical protein